MLTETFGGAGRPRAGWSARLVAGPKSKMRSVLVLTLFASVAGCSCDPAPACRVEGPDANGASTLVCPDGSRMVIPAERRWDGSGSLTGTARFFGQKAHAGIKVRLRDVSDRSAVTDDAG